jgi:hypothetical protein
VPIPCPASDDNQATALLTYTENRVTNAIESADTHRNPLPCEAVTFELTGYTLPARIGPAGRYQASDLSNPILPRRPSAPQVHRP